MTEIAELGFASVEAKQIEKNICRDFSGTFDLSDQLSSLFIESFSKSKIDSSYRDNLLINAAAARTFELFQSVDVLLRRGCTPAAMVLLRSQIESVYKFCAIAKEPELIEELIRQSGATRPSKLKSIQKYRQKHKVKGASPNVMKELEILSKNKVAKLRPEQWAEWSDMLDYHNIYYQGLNDEVHSNIESYDHYFDKDNNYDFTYGPSVQDLKMVAHGSQRAIINSLSHYQMVVELDDSEKISEIAKAVDIVFYDEN